MGVTEERRVEAGGGWGDWSAEVPWWVLRTKARQEKRLSDQLGVAGVWHYLPLCRRVRFYGHRKRVLSEPLFPGYVFLRAEREWTFWADRTGRVAQVLPVGDADRLERELGALWRAEAGGAVLSACRPLERGEAVEVVRGPLRGLRGVVERGGREGQLVLGVSIIGGAAEVEIDPSFLVRVGGGDNGR